MKSRSFLALSVAVCTTVTAWAGVGVEIALEGECEEERVFCVYQPNLAVDVGKPDRRVIVVNGAFANSVILDLPSVPSKAEAFDTFGDKVPLRPLTTGLNRVSLPLSGYLRIAWK